MSTDVIERPARRPAPSLPSGELPLEPPPAIPQPTGVRWQQWLGVLPMLAGTVATAMMFGGREGASTFTYVVGGVFGLSTLGMLVTSWGGANGPRRAELMQARRDYLRYLSGVRRQVRATIADQRTALNHRHPEPQTLWAEAMGVRVWERRSGDGDFGVVRIASGPQSLATPLLAPLMDPAADLEPVTAGALRRFLDTYAVVPDLPISLAIRAFPRVVLTDSRPDRGQARALARALVAQLVTFHAPDDLVVCAYVTPERRRDWEWFKWLPHSLHPTQTDALGPRRLVATNTTELDGLLVDVVGKRPRFQPLNSRGSDPPSLPHVIVIVDHADVRVSTQVGVPDGLAGVTLVEIAAPQPLDRSSLVLSIDAAGALHSSTVDDETVVGQADALTVVEAESLARRLAPLRLGAAVRDQTSLNVDRDLAGLLGLTDLRTAPLSTLWASRTPRELLRIPIGTGPDAAPVYLDIKEAAQDGMGPHGLVVGATGSGKSELLRTLVLGLAVTHSSQILNFVLVDFKGGATFASLDRLPHTSAVITNLAHELPLVDRMADAMSGELTRRQELLRQAGNFASIRDYDRARAAGVDLPPLPSLLLVCDEFTEMLTAKPDFIDLFLQIGRIGRSIGVHLLLATQRLEEGRLRGLETNLSYRIALRTFSASESRMAIGSSDAAELPPSPGHGFLKIGTGVLQRFRAAYVSGPYRGGATEVAAAPLSIVDYRTQHHLGDPAVISHDLPITAEDSLMHLIVARLSGQGAPAHRVWLAPLADAAHLDDLLGAVTATPERGFTTADSTLRGALRVPVAQVDRPFEQRRDTAWLDLSGSAGHVAIVGNPQSGKSTAVRTVVTALALTHTPAEVQVYCLDFGGGALNVLRDLPHVGGVAGRLDTAMVRRTVGEVATLLADRERRFTTHGIDSMTTFRRLRRPADLDATLAIPEDGFGDVFLVVDGWSTLRNDFDDLEPIVVDIATRGLSYGIHVVATSVRWNDFRATVRDLFGSRVELRLGDPSESVVGRKAAANVPPTAAGRGLSMDGLHILTAVPVVAGQDCAGLAKAMATAWCGPSAPPVRMLPAILPYSDVLRPTESGDLAPFGTGLDLPLGIAEADLRPVTADFSSEPHLMLFGDGECGKSSTLRALAESIIRRFTPEQARIVIIDYRRSLLGAVTTEHLIGYGSAAENTTSLVESIASYMDKRRPGADITPAQLRARSWWTGPECFVLVDDYDLVATGLANPLMPLIDHLAHARDVGLHLVLTRRAAGAGRALYEPVLQRLRELGTPGLILSGDREEGALLGTVRPGPQPPGRGWLVTRKHGARLVQLAYLGSD